TYNPLTGNRPWLPSGYRQSVGRSGSCGIGVGSRRTVSQWMSMAQDEVADFPKNSRSQRMNKILVTIVLGCAIAAAGQNAAQPQAQPAAPQAQPQAQPGAPPQQKKEIKDPAEYNAYVGAVQQQDPTAKISGLEAFLTQYPNSVMKEDALEILMGTYQQKGDVAKMGDAAKRLLAVNPNNVRALALSTFGATQQQNFPEAKANGEKGLQALNTFAKPDNMSEADYNTLKQQLAGIFHRGVGMAALNDKDFGNAVTHLRAASDTAPNDVTVIYPL